MDVSSLLDGLNDKQRDAVAAPRGNLLVLAGAGSGKTRVLVHRIAWLMQVERCSPFSILAVTFTNKAAAEMRGRVERVIGTDQRGMWIGTFHGIAHRLLRAHHLDAGLPQDFQILDSDDQYRLIRRVIKALNLDEKHWAPREVMGYINRKKDEGLRPGDIDLYGDPVTRTYQKIYQTYQETCDRAGLVDFAELLLRAHELWLHRPHILEHYRDRFQNILVDEFQDTNGVQYAWLRMLAGDTGKVMIVGDDDQSIYGWRGAKIENIQRFLTDYPGAETIRLEQNYRSTATILKAANCVIANNAERLGKELWTEGAEGEPISLYAAFNEVDEARFVVGRLKEWRDKGGMLADCAILYRSNAQSRILEEALMQDAMPYRIYGGLRFFERQEIKDALAYLRLINNRGDDASFERVVNTPTRGIGDRTLDIIRGHARDRGLNLWQASRELLADKVLSGRAGNAVRGFVDLIDGLEEQVGLLPLHQQADITIQNSGLKAMYLAEKGEKSQARVENLDELVTACRQFTRPEEADEMSDLSAFLANAALEAGEGQADEHADAVQLMTLHSAKGLEFPLVFMVGVEEGMFPSQQTTEEAGRLEEERRLCYVGMTRAMEKLYLCYAESRRIYGREMFHKPSRFIREMPAECLEEIRLRTQVSRPTQYGRFSQNEVQQSFAQSGFNLGQRVLHPKFGEGTVLNFEGVGPQSRVQIHFDDAGAKWLVAAYARLEAL
ncbi:MULTISPECIES: DNA helicase II [Aeromonas]|uniref:DNA 3'-5' helicase n=1 Tax=Aeromonas diversa CDC 2478-85 TaxID=1268237 RepID=N9VGC8_9GAMM|nr:MULTISPECIES: DNA helicase II [Aeromonas]ENY70461.1 DNA helicase II [Aeromonas diversa CDC 2478-85]QCG46649.1 DNA helicase II [Aeromonas schubertii]